MGCNTIQFCVILHTLSTVINNLQASVASIVRVTPIPTMAAEGTYTIRSVVTQKKSKILIFTTVISNLM